MTGASSQRIYIIFCCLAAVLTSGCADLDILPTWMPFQAPVSDTMPGVVAPSERIAKLRKLSEGASASNQSDRQRISRELANAIRDEKDPLIRMEIIRALGKYPSPEADAILKTALNDPDRHVRLAACEAWGKRNDATAVKLLAESLRSDVDADVRLAAAKALGETRNQEAVASLGEALNDADPAMQYRAVLSLKKATGKDLGNDVGRWQQYVKGETPAPAPTLAEQIRRLF